MALEKMTDKNLAIKIENLTKKFGTFTAVDDVSFAVNAGESFALIGPNGAGKSTIIKMLTTLTKPTAGGAQIAGYDMTTQAAEVRKHIGYIPQLLSSDGALTAWENMQLSARLYRIPAAEQKERIEESLNAMDLWSVAHNRAQSFSGGMIRRLEIAQSMLHRPAVIFMDEPTVGLDPSARNTVWKHVQRLRDEYKITIMLTTHYMEEVEALCGRLAILHHGRIAAMGSIAEVKASFGENVTLNEVFEHLAEEDSDDETKKENYREINRNRRSLAKRS
jgi:ABC-2 type transport system ATP-binding protein